VRNESKAVHVVNGCNRRWSVWLRLREQQQRAIREPNQLNACGKHAGDSAQNRNDAGDRPSGHRDEIDAGDAAQNRDDAGDRASGHRDEIDAGDPDQNRNDAGDQPSAYWDDIDARDHYLRRRDERLGSATDRGPVPHRGPRGADAFKEAEGQGGRDLQQSRTR